MLAAALVAVALTGTPPAFRVDPFHSRTASEVRDCSRGFDSLYGEWETTPDAKSRWPAR